MKKIFVMAVLAIVSTSLFAAKSIQESVQDILEGRALWVSPEVAQAWKDLKLANFDKASQEFEAIARTIDDPEIKDEYEDIAEELRELAEDFRSLPVPKADESMQSPELIQLQADALKRKARKVASDTDQSEESPVLASYTGDPGSDEWVDVERTIAS